MRIASCAFEGCRATTKQPGQDRWAYLKDFRPLADGYYCPAHAQAIERVLQDGGFADHDLHDDEAE